MVHFNCSSFGIERGLTDSFLIRRSKTISSCNSSLDGVDIDTNDEDIEDDREIGSIDCDDRLEISKVGYVLL